MIKKLSRRKFLQGTGLASGTLMLGVQFSPALANPASKLEFKPDVFVSMDETGQVTIISHRSEMGQGIRSTLPLLVADELEADWNRVTVKQALGDAKYGSQNTDGSRSVRKNYQKLKEAGAIMRTMLQQAAAQVWSVDPAQVQIENHQATYQDQNLDFKDLVKIASKLEVPARDSLRLKTEAEQKYVGKPNMANIDGQAIVTGTAEFGYDVDIEGMKVAVIARPPVVFGKVKSYDAVEALKVPGVLKVIELPTLKPPAGFNMLGGLAVIAEHTWAAIQGREKLKIEWDHGSNASYSTADHEAVFIKALEDPKEVVRARGDVAAANQAAAKTLTAEYHVAGLAHATMEPPAATARVTGSGADKMVEVWACTQTPQASQGNVVGTLSIPQENAANVKINVTLLGGGFGRKSKPDFVAEAAYLANETNLPIKVLWTREDEIKHGYYHSPSYQKLTGSLDENNQVTSWYHAMVNHPISSTFNPAAKTAGSTDLGQGDMMFDVPNIKIALGETDTFMRIGWVRSVTNINNVFAAASFVDELAHAAGQEPKAFLLNMIGDDRVEDFAADGFKYGNYGESAEQYPAETSRLKNVIELAAEKSGWGEKLPEGSGMGIAAWRSFLTYIAVVVKVTTDGNQVKIEDVHMAVDAGKILNPDRVKSQMEGSAIFGASLAFYGEITAKEGIIEQGNFDDYQMSRINQIPDIHTHIVTSDALPTGVGEPGLPPFAPALCNAIFAANGKRHRRLPMKDLRLV
ncbi:molybdopterin-dependent oxidoreductase [Marinicella sp. S1101]|uniref:xanthine dehydrogenase family protein molybdopterin-binding subunit n=1 Tax=Marinicella marina TaxID=2996016 RepID=UPI0022610039|nr:molybdopterin cofactor-binding domain-containing protein [Marinicella marina]MCX7552580.1 molybdopterin-dependent oxidoreductase [Marinicella marina]MDJ1139456.1 molybdopterin-dependent oxidoreductase [Marinicella marina]